MEMLNQMWISLHNCGTTFQKGRNIYVWVWTSVCIWTQPRNYIPELYTLTMGHSLLGQRKPPKVMHEPMWITQHKLRSTFYSVTTHSLESFGIFPLFSTVIYISPHPEIHPYTPLPWPIKKNTITNPPIPRIEPRWRVMFYALYQHVIEEKVMEDCRNILNVGTRLAQLAGLPRNLIWSRIISS